MTGPRELEFVDELPPPDPKKLGKSAVSHLRAQALRERPGEWARWPTKAVAKDVLWALCKTEGDDDFDYAKVERSVTGVLHHGCFEAAARGNGVYARYVGGGCDEP